MASKTKRVRGESSKSGGGENTSITTQPRPPPYRISLPHGSQRAQLATLDRRDIRPTLFYCRFTCEMLGINEDVVRFSRNLGFDGFLQNIMPNDWVTTDPSYNYPAQPPLTYRHLTLEFLASFELRWDTEKEGVDAFSVRFRLFNLAHTKTLREFNELFGWDPEAQILDASGDGVEGYDEQAWWARITDGSRTFLSNSSKASEIQHGALRYFHRMLVFCFFSRMELGKLSNVELHLLWRATEGANVYNPSLPQNKVNLGYLLALRCKTIRDDARSTGPIIIGGLVTWLAYQFGYKENVVRMDPENHDATLNADRLKNMKFITSSDGSRGYAYIWKIRELPWCYMPSNFMRNPPADTTNPWRIPMEEIDPRELSASEAERRGRQRAGRQQQQQQQQQQQHQQQALPPPPIHEGTFNIEQAFANLSLQINQLAQAQNVSPVPHPDSGVSLYQSQIYDYHVDQGHITPYVNYPYHPPQSGPVPNWESPMVDDSGASLPRTSCTYPYWQGPGTLHNPPRSFPPYNYTLPGGGDYMGDPNYPWENPNTLSSDQFRNWGFPSGYNGGWEPYGPPRAVDYKWDPEAESDMEED